MQGSRRYHLGRGFFLLIGFTYFSLIRKEPYALDNSRVITTPRLERMDIKLLHSDIALMVAVFNYHPARNLVQPHLVTLVPVHRPDGALRI
jgi:hypothetical protein